MLISLTTAVLCVWGAEIQQLPTWAKQWGVSLSVCYTTLSQRCGAVCTVTAECWHTDRTGGINTFSHDNLQIWACVCVCVCVCVCFEGVGAKPVDVVPDWPNSNNNAITTQRPPGIPQIETLERRRRRGEEGSDERKKMGCLCLSPTYVCVFFHRFRTAHSSWCLRTLHLLNVFCVSDSSPQALCCFYSPGGLI